MFPTTNLQPGQTGPEVQKLQQFLLSQGLLTEQQIATGPGIYGPQTTAAVRQWQQANGVNNSSGPGYWGPQSIAVASQSAGGGAQNNASQGGAQSYKDALAADPQIAQMSNPDAIASAYASGDWSNVISPSGMPFTKQQQEEAFAKASRALEPGFTAQREFDTANVQSNLQAQQEQFTNFLQQEGKAFEQGKQSLDQRASDSGILFSGARYQRENDLREGFENRQNQERQQVGRNIDSTARDFQYRYGNENANKLSNMYNLNQGNTYNANTAQNMVNPTTSMSSVYNPNKFNFQGTVLNNQKANTQVRASGLLSNTANKLLGQY